MPKPLVKVALMPSGVPHEDQREKKYNTVFCFLISFYDHLKAYFCELTLFDLSESLMPMTENCREGNFIPRI